MSSQWARMDADNSPRSVHAGLQIPKEKRILAVKKTSILFVLFLSLLGGCTTQQVVNTLTLPVGYRLFRNITYDPESNLQLDVYAPSGAVKAPVVVFFYSRRWERGNKRDVTFVGQSLSAKGYVVIIPNFRHYPNVLYQQMLSDSARAVVWSHHFAKTYGGSAKKLVVMGFDAGAYNAAMLALDPRWVEKAGGKADWIRGMIGISGPYDLLPIMAPDLRAFFAPASQYPLTQPINWVNGENPPLLLIASTTDHVVSARNTDELFRRVKAAHGPVEKITYRDLSHDMTLDALSAPLRGQADILSNIARFVRRVTRSPKSMTTPGTE